jgi:hypothetical protein
MSGAALQGSDVLPVTLRLLVGYNHQPARQLCRPTNSHCDRQVTVTGWAYTVVLAARHRSCLMMHQHAGVCKLSSDLKHSAAAGLTSCV